MPFQPVRPRDIALNVAFFAPFGWLGARTGWKPTRILSAALIVSVVTELVQVYSFGRWPSITDILMNVSGTLLGLLVSRF